MDRENSNRNVHAYMCINERHCLPACLSLFPTKIIIARLINILFIQLYITILDDHTASLSRAITRTTLTNYTHTLEYYIAYRFILLIDKKREDEVWTQQKMNLIFRILLSIHEHVHNILKENFLAKFVNRFSFYLK